MENRWEARVRRDRTRGWGCVKLAIVHRSQINIRIVRMRIGATWDDVLQRVTRRKSTERWRVLVDGLRVRGEIVFLGDELIEADVFVEQQGGGKTSTTAKKAKMENPGNVVSLNRIQAMLSASAGEDQDRDQDNHGDQV